MPQKDPVAYRAYQRRKHRETRIKRKAEAIAHLGGHCVLCQGTENLEFHHKDGSQKKTLVVHLTLYRWERLLEELNKCQLLCKACHMLADGRIDEDDYDDYTGFGSNERVYDDEVPF